MPTSCYLRLRSRTAARSPVSPPIRTALIGPASASNPPPVFIEGLRSGAAGFVSAPVLTADEDDCVVLDADDSPAEPDPVVELLVVELLVLVSVDELVLLDVAMSPTKLPTVVLEVVAELCLVASELDVDLSVLLEATASVLVSDEELAVVLVVVSVLVEGEVVACVDDDSAAELDPVVAWLVLVSVGVLSLVSVRVSLLELAGDEVVALLEEVAVELELVELASFGLFSPISVRVSLLELVDVDDF